MTLVATDAIVLHAFDYRETSRILRLVTRDYGVRAVVARGARRPHSRFGVAVDLFAEGAVQLALHPTADLHTLLSFDVTRARPQLAELWERFAAANALSELMLRFARDDAHPELFVAFRNALDALGRASEADVSATGLGAAWRLVAELGFAPTLDSCASCGAPVPAAHRADFSHRAGGVVCARCAGGLPARRSLPPDARSALTAWLSGTPGPALTGSTRRAHLRLLREFVQEHLGDDRRLNALTIWLEG